MATKKKNTTALKTASKKPGDGAKKNKSGAVKAAKTAPAKTLKKAAAQRQVRLSASQEEKKQSAGKSQEQLDLSRVKEELLEMRDELLQRVSDKKNLDIENDSSGDAIDLATRSLDNEMISEVSSNDRKKLHDINAALRKIEKKVYGVCEHCLKPIEQKRLKYIPEARYCMKCQGIAEISRINEESSSGGSSLE